MNTDSPLNASAERFRALVEAAGDAIICLEAPGKIYFWNQKAEEIFGYVAKEALGLSLHALIAPERYRAKAREGLDGFFRTGTGAVIGRTIELAALKKDGKEFPVELSVAAFRMDGVWHAIGIVRDITERKRQGEGLKKGIAEMERMNKLMVGRELKMEELREEVRVLRQRLKEFEGA
ncbi:MAG: PAS domain S-box protein [Deltaproteobacteria bacterium]|nr:PAS domain S-box protein [Deltaproteobacteria bacterium]